MTVLGAIGNGNGAINISSYGTTPGGSYMMPVSNLMDKGYFFDTNTRKTNYVTGRIQELGQNVSRKVYVFNENFTNNYRVPTYGAVYSDPTTGVYRFNLGAFSGNVSVVAIDYYFTSTITMLLSPVTNTVNIAVAPTISLNNCYILIDSEYMLVTAGGLTTTLTVSRAQRGSVAANHASGATISKIMLNNEIYGHIVPGK